MTEVLFFLYTIAIICVSLIASSVSLVVWLMTRKRDCPIIAGAYVVYAMQLCLIFFDEYSRAKLSAYQMMELPLAHPIASLVLGIGFVSLVWCWTVLRVHARLTPKRALGFILPFAVGSCLLVPRNGFSGVVPQYLYWLWRDLGIVACLGFAAWYTTRRTTKVQRLDIMQSSRFFIAVAALIALVIAEDTFMILFSRYLLGTAMGSSFLWHISERNISENVMVVVSTVFLLKKYRSLLSIYAHYPNFEAASSEAPQFSDDDIESRLILFGDAHDLSRREQEVLALAVRGIDIQNIASELVIAPGTVKTHLHRIYTKADVKSRQELIERFWSS